MSYNRWTWPVGVLLGVAGSVGVALWGNAPVVVADGPLAQITAPPSGFKLRQGQTMPVRVRVQPGARPLRGWTLRLVGAEGEDELARGSEAVFNRAVTQVQADGLEAGETYTLALTAEDGGGITATRRVSFLIPDPPYTLIPLDSGNMARNRSYGFSVDGSGNVVAMGGTSSEEFVIVDAESGSRQTVQQWLTASGAFRVSGDGRRVAFAGVFRRPPFGFALGFLDIASNRITQGPLTTSQFLSTDRTGRLVAFQSVFDLDPSVGNPNRMEQYFLYDDATKEVRQLTSDPHAIDREAGCPRIVGTTPVISGDGSTVAFASSATLGLAPSEGCHVFVYDVGTATLRHVLRLPHPDFDLPVISDDGRWLTFLLSRPVPPYILSRGTGALVDLESGALIEPVGGIADFPTFDAVITADGNLIVVSTQADLDPRVGNPDHNMELFVYDRATREFTQISETTGGIGRFPGGCAPYRPRTNANAHVIVFGLPVFSVEGCQLDGSQRHEIDRLILRRVRAVRKRPGNRGPVLAPLSNTRVVAGESVELGFTAADPDGDRLTFFAQVVDDRDIPSGSDMKTTATAGRPSDG